MEFKILDQLDRIEKLITGKYTNKYLDIHQVSDLTSVSARAIKRGELKCIKKLGKLLFLEKDVRNWLGG